MHRTLTRDDLESGLDRLNTLMTKILTSLPLVESALVENVTTPMLLVLYLQKYGGPTLTPEYAMRAATMVGMINAIPVPQALILDDNEFYALMFMRRVFEQL